MNTRWAVVLSGGVFLVLMVAACTVGSATPELSPTEPPEEGAPLPKYEIVTLLPRDAIRSIDHPQFLSAEDADQEYAPDEMVLGVEINDDARAYSIRHLSGHEIVNDVVGGVPVAITW